MARTYTQTSVVNESLGARSTREVFEDHLRLRDEGRLEQDLARNYAPDVVLLHINGVVRGHEGMRTSASRLGRQLPDAGFEFVAKHVAGEYAYLEWRATSPEYRVEDGADSFVIKNGKIVMQTVHYTLLPSGDQSKASETG